MYKPSHFYAFITSLCVKITIMFFHWMCVRTENAGVMPQGTHQTAFHR